MRNEIYDITNLFFPLGDISPAEERLDELWARATERAYELVGSESPMELLKKTEEYYHKYLREDEW